MEDLLICSQLLCLFFALARPSSSFVAGRAGHDISEVFVDKELKLLYLESFVSFNNAIHGCICISRVLWRALVTIQHIATLTKNLESGSSFVQRAGSAGIYTGIVGEALRCSYVESK